MSDVIIQAEGVGKSYRIAHRGPSERYTALRDVLARQARDYWNSARRGFRAQQPSVRDRTEEFWALRDVSFEIKRGEVVGIIGRNGAGKSTLLKILSRITELTEGRVRIRGRIASLLEVGTGFHPELTGRENIYLNGSILGMTRAEIRRQFDAIVAFADVEKFLDTPVKRYSSGMYVRLAFSVAAHMDPEILVIDEVLAVGDAQFQKKCLGKMEDVARGGRTVLFVSHDLTAVNRICSRALLLDRGTTVCAGATGAVTEQYRRAADGHHAHGRVLETCGRHARCRLSDISVQCREGDVVLSMSVSGAHALPLLGIGVAVRAEDGGNVLALRPAKTGFGVRNSDLPCNVTVVMPDLERSLSGGRYWVSLWVIDPGIERLGELNDAVCFDVSEKHLYPTERGINARDDGVFAIPCRFSTAPRISEPPLSTAASN